MAAIHKPVDGFDRPTDGFDPLALYQLIPFRQTRPMGVITNDAKAELSFTTPDICRMSNFRIIQQSVPNLIPLPRDSVRRITLPEKSTIQFDLEGTGVGTTILESRDRDANGNPSPQPQFSLRIAVRQPKTRRFAVFYVFDRIHPAPGRRLNLPAMFNAMNDVYRQANIALVAIDNGRDITLPGSFGQLFNLDSAEPTRRLINKFEQDFPLTFGSVDSVMFILPVPIGARDRRSNIVIDSGNVGLARPVRRESTGQKFDTIFISSIIHDNDVDAPVTLAHEIGHRLGLVHEPNLQGELRLDQVFPGFDPRDTRPFRFAPASMHNLMFPIDIMGSTRLNAEQLERLHTDTPVIDGDNVVTI